MENCNSGCLVFGRRVQGRASFTSLFTHVGVVAIMLMVSSFAQAGTVSGSIWNDLNADTFVGEAPGGLLGDNILTQQGLPNNNAPDTYGDPAVPGAGFENGLAGIQVCAIGSITLPTAPASVQTFFGTDLCTTTDANGDYSLVLPDGAGNADLRVVFSISATAGFDFSSPTPVNDTDVTANPPPSNSSDPQTGFIDISSYDGSDIVDGLDAGLSPTPVIVMNRFDTNPVRAGIQDFITGTPDFNVYGGCTNTDPDDPTNNQDPDAGDDCAKYDDYIRSNDLLTSFVELKVDNTDADGVENVVVEYQWTPNDGASLALQGDTLEGLPTPCLTGNNGNGVPYNPQSNVSVDPVTGTLKLICNAGTFVSGDALSLPVSIKVSGPDGASVDTEIKAYAQANDAVPSQELEGPPIEVSAAPRFDLTKNSGSATSPPNGLVVSGAVRFETNEVTGQLEPGYLVWYDISIVADPANGGKGVAPLDGTVEFKEFIDPSMSINGAKILCDFTATTIPPGGTGYLGHPVGAGIPNGGQGSVGVGPPYRDDAVADAGITNCTSPTDPTTGETGYTITGMDSSGIHFPRCGRASLANCVSTEPWSYVYAARMPVWYPYSALFKSSDPAWAGDVNDPSTYINGTYRVENCVGDFDPNTAVDGNGNQVSNYGDEFEPGWVLDPLTGEYAPEGNNCRTLPLSVQVGDGIGFAKRFCANVANPSLAEFANCHSGNNLSLDGQSGLDTGDGVVTADKLFHSGVQMVNSDFFNVIDEPWLCDAIDNSMYTFAPWSGGISAGEYDHITYVDRAPYLPGSTLTNDGHIDAEENGWLVEYARFTAASGRKTWQINHDTSGSGTARPDNTLPISNPQQQAAAKDCGVSLTGPNGLEWSTDPDASGWPVDELVMVRVRPDPAWEAANGQRAVLTPREALYAHFRFQAREVFWEPDSLDGEDGTPIPTGTIVPNQAQFQREGFPLSTDPNDPPANFVDASYNPDTHMGINTSGVSWGDRAIFTGIIVTIDKKAFDVNVGETPGDDGLLEELAGEQVNWTLEPQVISESSFGTPTATNVIITDVLPNFTTYNSSCSDTPAFYSGPAVSFNTPAAGQTTLTWTAGDVAAGTPMPIITICTDTAQLAPAPVDVTNDVEITADNVPFVPGFQRDRRTVRLLQTARFAVQKAVDQSFDFQDQDQVWTLTWKNTSETVTLAPPDVIDVLPYNGDAELDAPGQRETFASSYAGTLGLASWPPAAPVVTLDAGGTRTDNGTWYLTGVDPLGGIIALDPDAKNTALNGTPFDSGTSAPADLSTGATAWCTDIGVTAENGGACPATLAEVTAIRWVSTDFFSPGDTAVTEFTAIVDGNKPNDFYINRFTGAVENFTDSVRSNEPFVQVVGFSLGDLIWLDLNGDGIYNPGTDLPAPAGVTVNLFNADGSPATDLDGNSSTTTDANGRWLFEGIAGDSAVSSGTYLAGEFYVTVTGLPVGWTVDATSPTFEADPNVDSNETADHHTLLDAGTIRSSGVITLSANVLDGLISGDEPTSDNVAVLGDPLVQDAFTNFTLDLMLVPLRGDIKIVKDVAGGGPLADWEFTITPVDATGCPLPNAAVSPMFTNPVKANASGEAGFEDLLINNTTTGAVCQYNIAETAMDGWTQTAVSPAGPYQVDADTVLDVEFTNTRDVGNIEVTKTVDGADAPDGWAFTLTSLVTGCDIPTTVTNPATTTDGSGGKVTFTGLPTHSASDPFGECNYQIAETAQTGWTLKTAAANLTNVTVTDDETTDVAVLNEANPLQARVAKTVTGADATLAWSFGFSLTTTDDIDPILTSADALSSGTGSSTSTDFVTWDDLQPGQTYVLAETAVTGYVSGALSCKGLDDIDGDLTDASITFVAPSGDLNDPVVTFEVDCAITNQRLPDLVVSKSVQPEAVRVGDTLTYTIKVRNDGILASTGVELTDVMPAGVTLVSATPSGDTSYDKTTGVWTVGTVLGGGSATLTLTAKLEPVAGVCAADYTNQVSVTSTGVDLDTENNSDRATSSLLSLGLAKRLSDASPIELVGGLQQVTYEFMVVNNGGEDLTKLQIVDDLDLMIATPNPNGATYVVTDVSSPDQTLTPNKDFDGSANQNILAGNDTLIADAIGRVNITIILTPDVYFGPFINSATASGETGEGLAVRDVSQNGSAISTDVCVYDEPTPLRIAKPSTPITLGWFRAEQVGGSVHFDWETEVEVSNAGFYIAVLAESGDWQVLNDDMIGASGDSTNVQSYSFIADGVDGELFRFIDVSVTGKQKTHGPFELGREYGVKSEHKKTDWLRLGEETETKKEQREQQQVEQLQRKMQQMKNSSNGPLSYDPVESQTPLKQRAGLGSRIFGVVASVLSSMIAPVNAMEVVNFEIESPGIYRVGHADLLNLGFDFTGFEKRRIGLRTDNQLAPVKIHTGGSSVFTSTSYIEFPARAKQTLYSGLNRYTLVLDEGQSLIEPDLLEVPFKGAATSYLAESTYAEQNHYTHLSPSADDSWYADRLVAISKPAHKTVSLKLKDQANSLHVAQSGIRGASSQAQGVQEKPTLHVKLWGASALPGDGVAKPDHHAIVELNGVAVADEKFDGLRVREFSVPLAQTPLVNNVVKVMLPKDNDYQFDLVNIDSISLTYPRKFIAEDNGQSLVFSSRWDKFRIRGLANDEIIVYRTDGGSELGFEMTGRGTVAVDQSSCTLGECMVVFPGSDVQTDSVYYVATESGVKLPAMSVAPQEQDLFNGQASVLIISHPDFIASEGQVLETYAAELAEIYGSVDIVSTESIYAQYSGHVPDANAIASYVADSYDNRDSRHLVLVGGDMYDYHDNLQSGAKSYVPSLYVPIAQNLNSVPSDAKYADIDDDFVPDMTVTRLPVRSVQELTTLLTKRTQYIARTYTNKVMFAADKDDASRYSFKNDSNSILNSYFNSGWSVDRAYVGDDENASQVLVDGINSGSSITSFFGHSSTDRWAINGLFTGDDAAGLTNVGEPTVVTQWGCWNTFYVSPNEDSMAHRLLVEGPQGAVTVMGASSLTKADAEKRMAEFLFENLTQGMRIGDAVLAAKRSLAEENPYQLDVLLGWTVLGPSDMVVN